MSNPNFFILYVDQPLASAKFYEGLLGKAPVEAGPTFAMFALDSVVMLGLWSKHTVAVPDKETVASMHAAWVDRSLVIAQQPVDMDFGYTFVALDPDGHRLRVFAAAHDQG
jgi:predicted enzyme related to lactoylglutathione lyase